MEVIPSLTTDKSGFLYDQRVGQTSFGISISLNHIAYNAYNWGGVTYINGKLNTTMNGKRGLFETSDYHDSERYRFKAAKGGSWG